MRGAACTGRKFVGHHRSVAQNQVKEIESLVCGVQPSSYSWTVL